MGCTARDKHIRTTRRARSASRSELPPESSGNHIPSIRQTPLHHDNLPSSSTADESSFDYCTEDQLQEILMNNLEELYKEAVMKLVGLGYSEDAATKAILAIGHGYYGGMDVLTNIMHNAIAYLKGKITGDDSDPVFTTFRQLEEYSLAGMICMLQQVKPKLSRGEAMWCLLMSDLHVDRASTVEFQLGPGNDSKPSTVTSETNETGSENSSVAPPLSLFHGGWGFGNGGTSDFITNGAFSPDINSQNDVECPKRFNLPPAMKALLKKNVSTFTAGFRANSMHPQTQPSPSQESSTVEGTQEGINSMTGKFRDLSFDQDPATQGEDQKNAGFQSLVKQARELDKQVRERKEWAQEKAIQAARKLTNDLTELKLLRMEREESQRVKKGKQTLEDATMKKLSEMENALRKASGQVDRANSAVRRLETENAEIRAEMEASKLSASESASTCQEVTKREKKWLKKLAAWEKQREKMEEELGRERESINQMQMALRSLEQQGKDAEERFKEEAGRKAKAIAEAEEERRRKEAAEVDNKQKVEKMRVKMEMEFQRYKDDVERLEQELAQLSASEARGRTEGEAPLRVVTEVAETCDRDCVVCGQDDVAVVFLPCAHQVVCVACADGFGYKGKAACPCCRSAIEHKIRVFGASS